MRQKLIFLSVILRCLFSGILAAQAFPVDTTLNYTEVPLVAEIYPGASKYLFHVEFLGANKRLTLEVDCNTILLPKLPWNQSYRWQCSYLDAGGKVLSTTPEFRFWIKGNNLTDKSNQKLEIIRNEENNAGGMIFMDHALSAVRRDGDFAWFLPANPLWDGQWDRLRDIRLTEFGTVTFIHEGKGIFETDLAGNVLWMRDSPVKDTAMDKRYFHHEFFRRGDEYFVLGLENHEKHFKGDTASQKVPYDIVLIYSKHVEKPIFRWEAKDYFKDKEFIALRGTHKMTPGQGHMNSLSVSEDGEYLYGGFRNISRIVKIRRKNGKVVKSYGQELVKGRAEVGNSWFRRQHNGNILPGGRILVFNNDSVMKPEVSSSIVIFDENAQNEEDGLLWKFNLKFDTLSEAKCTQTGSAEELPNGHILAGLGTVNRILEITPEKKVVWDAFILHLSAMEKGKWEPFPQYRVHHTPSLHPQLTGFASETNADGLLLKFKNLGSSDAEYQVIAVQGSSLNVLWKGPVSKSGWGSIQIPNEMLGKAEIKLYRKGDLLPVKLKF